MNKQIGWNTIVLCYEIYQYATVILNIKLVLHSRDLNSNAHDLVLHNMSWILYWMTDD